MVSVERIKQFTNIPSEAAWEIKNCVPSPAWPTKGDITISDLQVRYRPNTPLVLKGITLSFQGGEKIGVVGRTGGGKSTLIQTLFRNVEPCGGKIVIDEVDICTLGLHDLRSRFGIIPQEPVLFEGTVRSNIDPIGQYSDEEIWQSLERCQLKDVVAAKPEKLDALGGMKLVLLLLVAAVAVVSMVSVEADDDGYDAYCNTINYDTDATSVIAAIDSVVQNLITSTPNADNRDDKSNAPIKSNQGGSMYGHATCSVCMDPYECISCLNKARDKAKSDCPFRIGATITSGECMLRFEGYPI